MNEHLTVKSKEKELENLREEMTNKTKAVQETQTSFKYQVQSALINTNISKYTFQTPTGRAMRQTVVNNDIHILEKHFKGRVPTDMLNGSKYFQDIIDQFNRGNRIVNKKTLDPTKRNLEARGIVFPNFPIPKSPMDENDQLQKALTDSNKENYMNIPLKKRFKYM